MPNKNGAARNQCRFRLSKNPLRRGFFDNKRKKDVRARPAPGGRGGEMNSATVEIWDFFLCPTFGRAPPSDKKAFPPRRNTKRAYCIFGKKKKERREIARSVCGYVFLCLIYILCIGPGIWDLIF